MRRRTLSTKLFTAALPLLIAVAALLAVTVMSDLNKVQRAEDGAQLGALWSPMLDTFVALDAERDAAAQILAINPDDIGGSSGDPEALAAAVQQTDTAFRSLDEARQEIGDDPAAAAHIVSARSAIGAARRNTEMRSASMMSATDPLDAYETATAELVALGRLLPPAAGDSALGRELYAVVKIAETNLASNSVIKDIIQWQADPADRDELISARNSLLQIESSLAEFETIAPAEWASKYRQSGLTIGFASFRIDIDRALKAEPGTEIEAIDTAAFRQLVSTGTDFQREISTSSVLRAQAEADAVRRDSLIRIGVILGAVLIAGLAAWAINRSITRRVKAVAANANQVADVQLPALVEAIRDPRGGRLPEIERLSVKGGDELTELAKAFNSMQRTLVEVAEEQTAVLRRGVSDIFITMARRNRSLVDRQLAMLDEFESNIDDPEILSNFYDLDHLATRMRRNSESLLVLANVEPRRRQIAPTSIDDVVRASIGEVEDYRRITIEALDGLDVRGNVVADISHMLAELLDNATAFSPPEAMVQIGGRAHADHYLIRINDGGLGIPADRLATLNDVLEHPPIVGLSVEPTLGISVVSLLAKKHGIKVVLKQANPGTTVDIILPTAVFAVAPDAPADAPAAAPAGLVPAGLGIDHPVAVAPVAASATPSAGLRIDESFLTAAVAQAAAVPEVAPEPVPAADVPTNEPTEFEFDFHMGDPSQHLRAEEVIAPAIRDLTISPATISPAPAVAEAATAQPDIEPTGEPMRTTEPATETPTQLDRPVISPRLTDAFARSELRALATEPVDESAAEPVSEPVSASAAYLPPPPVLSKPGGEFHRVPAPPRAATGATSQPVSPAHAHPAPVPPTTQAPDLPVRSPKRDVDGGPDRLNPAAAQSTEPAEDQDAVHAAIAAFDQQRNHAVPHQAAPADAPEAPAALPTRVRTTVRVPDHESDQPESTTSSHLDPAELRSRLRSFQSEFRTGQGADRELRTPDTDPPEDQ